MNSYQHMFQWCMTSNVFMWFYFCLEPPQLDQQRRDFSRPHAELVLWGWLKQAAKRVKLWAKHRIQVTQGGSFKWHLFINALSCYFLSLSPPLSACVFFSWLVLNYNCHQKIRSLEWCDVKRWILLQERRLICIEERSYYESSAAPQYDHLKTNPAMWYSIIVPDCWMACQDSTSKTLIFYCMSMIHLTHTDVL